MIASDAEAFARDREVGRRAVERFPCTAIAQRDGDLALVFLEVVGIGAGA
jgi:hypothetical protein